MEVDHLNIANKKSAEEFKEEYLPPPSEWAKWTHPKSNEQYDITLHKSSSLSADDLDACFRLIELTSGEDYKRSRGGWKPKAKRKEMRLLDLKYLLVRKAGDNNDDGNDGEIEGFCSLMPTTEDELFVIYCYEIHLARSLQGTGLGTRLMTLLETIGVRIPNVDKVMLTCFASNSRALGFYRRRGYETDEYSPRATVLRNGTRVEPDYVILSKMVER